MGSGSAYSFIVYIYVLQSHFLLFHRISLDNVALFYYGVQNCVYQSSWNTDVYQRSELEQYNIFLRMNIYNNWNKNYFD